MSSGSIQNPYVHKGFAYQTHKSIKIFASGFGRGEFAEFGIEAQPRQNLYGHRFGTSCAPRRETERRLYMPPNVTEGRWINQRPTNSPPCPPHTPNIPPRYRQMAPTWDQHMTQNGQIVLH